jgi:hypothetical protein
MTHDEIQKLFVRGPEEKRFLDTVFHLEAIKSQLDSINSRITKLESEVRKAG